jgi:NitT/TauT family transport system substrate-binding protein
MAKPIKPHKSAEIASPKRRTFLGAAGASMAALACPELLLPRPSFAQDGRKVLPVGSLLFSAAHDAAMETARAKGIVEQQGLQISPQKYAAGANLMTAMAAGDIVAGVCGCNPALLSKAQGLDLKILANANLEGSALIVGPDIKGPKDLDGKKVGTPGIAAIQDTLMRIYEQQHGIKTQHEFIKVTDMPIMLHNGEIAGYIVWEVTATAGLPVSGGRILATSHDIRADHECCALIASGKFLRDDPDSALRLVRSFAMGLKYAVQNPQELNQIVSERDQVTPDQARSALAHVKYKYPPINDPAELVFVVKALMQAGKIEANQVPDMDRFIADSLDSRMIRSVAT